MPVRESGVPDRHTTKADFARNPKDREVRSQESGARIKLKTRDQYSITNIQQGISNIQGEQPEVGSYW